MLNQDADLSQVRLEKLLSLVIHEQVDRYLSSLAVMAAGLDRISGVVARLEQQASAPLMDGDQTAIAMSRLVKVGAQGKNLPDDALQCEGWKDTGTGLLWILGAEPKRTYDWYTAAELRTKGLIFCGLSGWRLPTLKELESLHATVTQLEDDSCPLLEGADSEVWSSTSSSQRMGYALVLDFRTGERHVRHKLDFRHIRLVRSEGEPLR
jgi:hypothetical protein